LFENQKKSEINCFIPLPTEKNAIKKIFFNTNFLPYEFIFIGARLKECICITFDVY
jgi:hypothetical protein